MARIRTIKPEFWDDEKLATIPRDARLLFIGMWNFSDDYSVVKGHPSWLRNKIFPYDDIKQAVFNEWLECLVRIRAIIPFDHNGEKFFYIRTFKDHQNINRPSAMRNPEAPHDISESNRTLFSDDSVSNHGALTAVREGKGKVKGREGNVVCEHEDSSNGNGAKPEKRVYLESVNLTDDEHGKLIGKYGEPLTAKAIEILNNAIQSKGYKYKSHYHTLIGWPMKEAMKETGTAIGVSEKTRQTLEAGKRWLAKHEGSRTLPGEHGDPQ